MTYALQNKLNEFLEETMDLYDLPGLAVGVSVGLDEKSPDYHFEFTGARGYGAYKAVHGHDSGSEFQLQPEDIFHCASVSKLFTSSAVMKLVEAGVIGLYDRLCNLLPDIKPCIADWRFDEIRLWNMLTHTSGLGDCYDYEWEKAETDDASLARYVYSHKDCISQPMLWCPQLNPEFYGVPETDENGNPLVDEKGAPRSLFRYSNVAYEILGQIVAEYSDRMPDAEGPLSYEDFVSKYLLEPAAMNSSTMKTFERPGWSSKVSLMQNQATGLQGQTALISGFSPMALPHEKADDRSIKLVEIYPYNRKHAPSSTLTSTTADLLKWGRAHMQSAAGRSETAARNELLLHKETYDSIWRDYATVPNNGEKMGLGWFMRKQTVNTSHGSKEYTLYGHEGTDDGFRASFWMCPELEMVTVVLSNLSNAPVKKINKKLFETIIKSESKTTLKHPILEGI